jgi:hypothetical protein
LAKHTDQGNDEKIARSPDVLSRVLDGEAVLLDTQGGAYFGLNVVGTRVWELIGTEGTTKRAIVAALLREFDVAADTLERDVTELVAGLEKRGLIRVTR